MGKYLFLIKNDVILPLTLTEEGIEKIIEKLVEEKFYISHIYVDAKNSEEAFTRYHELMHIRKSLACDEIHEAYVG